MQVGVFENASRLSGLIRRSSLEHPEPNLPRGNTIRLPDPARISFFRNRAYDQQTGRWTQEDPMGVAGGLNLYQFNGNNPAAYTDPFGLCTPPTSPTCQFISSVADRVRPLQDFVENGVGEVTGINDLGEAADGLARGEIGGAAMAMVPLVIPAGRVEASLGRVGAKVGGLLSHVGASDLSGAARVLRGISTGFDHVAEVRDAARGLRRAIRQLNGIMGNPGTTEAEHKLAGELLGRASRALDAAERALGQ